VSARLKLFILFIACAAPFVLGWAAWYFQWGTGAPGNYGELLPPRPIAGAPFEDLRGKWVLVNFDSAACDAYCEKKLYFMRQVRTAQGKDQGRVERLWIITDSGRPRPELLAAIEGTRISRTKPDAFPGEPLDHIYVIDPLGNLMMRFPKDPDPSRMLKDLQRLLKYSQVG
jgi:hypothetical protein